MMFFTKENRWNRKGYLTPFGRLVMIAIIGAVIVALALAGLFITVSGAEAQIRPIPPIPPIGSGPSLESIQREAESRKLEGRLDDLERRQRQGNSWVDRMLDANEPRRRGIDPGPILNYLYQEGEARRQAERQAVIERWLNDCGNVRLQGNVYRYETCVEEAFKQGLITWQRYQQVMTKVRQEAEYQWKLGQVKDCLYIELNPECLNRIYAVGLLTREGYERAKAELELEARCLALKPVERLTTLGCKVQ